MQITPEEVSETLAMVSQQHLDVRTITLGLNLRSCTDEDINTMARKVYDRMTHAAENLVPTAEQLEREYGVPIVNKRISTTPIAEICAATKATDFTPIAEAMDKAGKAVGVNFIGGFSALVQKGATRADEVLMDSIPAALSATDFVCSSVNVASTRAGINMDALWKMANTVIACAKQTAEHDSIGAAKLVVFANAVQDNPFMAGAFHGAGEADEVINVGVSGPGVVRNVLADLPESASMTEIAEAIKATAFKITRVGELMAREAADRLGYQQGILDLSLAPTPAIGDSVADILETIGVGRCGGPGTTAALALLNDCVKKGGVMASSSVGGLSGAFIPVSEDAGMIRAAQDSTLSLEKLEAMTCVCSVGLDMIAIPGNTTPETIFGIIADEAAIGMINNKTTAVRVIPAIGKKAGDTLEFGGLLGSAPVMPVNQYAGSVFAHRGGRIPAPLNSLKN
ncbi:PFL family protein [Cryptobacterium curtum]|uniref:PFL family protein n=1 Tax=Cryptobacterium curtum TaxID=84163 RepID=UPI00248F1C9E|nr:PFL family protein [Cryptobacterium curtum]